MTMLKSMFSVFLAAAIFAIATVPAHGFSMFGSHDKVEPVDGMIVLDEQDLRDGKAHYYRLDHDGQSIKFFVLESSDGVIRAAFDACDVCYQSRKGYSQDGEFMVCNNCGRRFHSSMINEVSGGCNPAPLLRTLQDGKLTIAVADILAGARFF